MYSICEIDIRFMTNMFISNQNIIEPQRPIYKLSQKELVLTKTMIKTQNISCNCTSFHTLLLDNTSSCLWKTISPIIFSFGLVGNSFIVYILMRMGFWKKTTYIYLFILAVSDSTVLCVGLSRRWILEVFDVDVRLLSNIGCKVNLFVVYFSMHISSWTLVCLTAERFLKVKFPFHYITSNVSKKMMIVYIVVFITCILVNCHFFGTNALVEYQNKQQCNNTSIEYYIFEEKYFSIIDLVILSVIPFILMFSMNFVIGDVLRKSQKFRTNVQLKNQSGKFNKKSKRLTRMLFFTSMYFLCSTFPISALFVLDSYLPRISTDQLKTQLNLATTIFYLLQFTNYGVNFFIYVTINKHFRRYLPRFVSRLRFIFK